VFLGDLDPEAVGPSIVFATHYEPTPIGDATRLLDAVPIEASAATFVDLGAGMGRVILLAALRTYRAVVGIELSPALAQIARDNLAAFDPPLPGTRVRVLRGDARTYRFPRGDLVVYLYNPFRAEVLAPVVDHLIRGPATRDVVIVYHTPLERAVIDETGAFDIVEDLGFGLVYRRHRPPTAAAAGLSRPPSSP